MLLKKVWGSLSADIREKKRLDGIFPFYELELTMFYMCVWRACSAKFRVTTNGLQGLWLPSACLQASASWLQKHYLRNVFQNQSIQGPASKIQVHYVLNGPRASVFIRFSPGSPYVLPGWKMVAQVLGWVKPDSRGQAWVGHPGPPQLAGLIVLLPHQ